MVVVLDLDGVIAVPDIDNEHSRCQPVPGAKEAILQMKAQGHKIIIDTARPLVDTEVTEKWLRDEGIPFDELHLGKPRGDIYLDDKGMRFNSWCDASIARLCGGRHELRSSSRHR